MRAAVFLDRDGTMVHDVGYLARHADLRWYPYTVDAVRLLNRAGFLVFVTTNQGGIGLGLYTEVFVQELHAAMAATLDSGGAHVDGWFYCPHHPRAHVPAYQLECECRKPRPGMIRRAAEQFDIDLTGSFVIGDKAADVGLATAAGARGVLVRTGHGADVLDAHGGTVPGAAHVAADLMAAVAWVLMGRTEARPA
jgi:D-glycero-D-manno-heptose 1,7-bisphosphate phosphatase